jgi:hypothetical protein
MMAQALALTEGEAHVTDRRHLALGRGEAGGQVLDLENHGRRQ